MSNHVNTGDDSVNCRIGSLEMRDSIADHVLFVNCRIGSLEILRKAAT